jgi:hypothetical protein
VCVCVFARAYSCVRALVGVCARDGTCACARVALLIQHSTRRHIVICGLSGSTILFRHYFVNGTIFGKRLLNIKCVFLFSLQLLFEIILIIRTIQRDVIINVKTSSCRVAVFSTEFRIKLKYQISSKSVQWELSCFMRTDVQRDGQTYMTKLVVDFCNFFERA